MPILAAVLGGALVIGSAIAVPRALRDQDTADPAQTGTRTGTTIEGLEVYGDEELGTAHTKKDVDYPQTPPVGGAHAPAWLACGPYDEPVRDENAVHDLEHGSVWISYRPDLAADDVATLEAVLPDNGIMAPYPGLDAPVVLTVWGRQLVLDDVDDPRVEQFMEQFGAGEAGLEAFVSCEGGVRDPGGATGADA